MLNEKKWYESKAVWGGIISVASIAGGAFGYTVSDGDQEQLATAFAGAGATFGAVLSIVGRIKATHSIGR